MKQNERITQRNLSKSENNYLYKGIAVFENILKKNKNIRQKQRNKFHDKCLSMKEFFLYI